MKTELYGLKTDDSILPLVVLNCDEDASGIYELCRQTGSPGFILAVISGFDWNSDLSPWPHDPVFKGTPPFAGKADAYLSLITDSLLPQIEAELDRHGKKVSFRALVGYSLAGLFALYSAYRCDMFERIVSASGSLWYSGFLDYVQNHPLSPNVKHIYLSLGDKESRTSHPLMKTVEDNTKRIYEILSDKTDVYFEFNEGNHFQDPALRTAKGISCILNI